MSTRDVSEFTNGQGGDVGSVIKLPGKYDLLSGQRESVRFPCKKDTSWEEAPMLVNLLTSQAPALFPLELCVGRPSILWALDTREDVGSSSKPHLYNALEQQGGLMVASSPHTRICFQYLAFQWFYHHVQTISLFMCRLFSEL
ncbi:hypothetical protein E2C01_041107 [Portunus trituberculatus]|uniref:Uncharacterized protein n=1 Tax=Portunus trituberculatus TaxID=210409 RepID=A0A5B7FQK6_PORTR|nr:hypothetical protein [Portunus trituberculatus]